MPKAKDLTGKKFGRLTVVEATKERDKSGSIVWECRCDCGSIVNARSRGLVSGRTRSCGCLKNELLANRTKKDLTGMRFGRLTAMRETVERKSGSVVWECRCDCGAIVKVRAHSLMGGNSKSCGCYNRDVAKDRMAKKVAVDCVDGTRLSILAESKFKNNSSGIRGVRLHKNSGLWIATIGFKKEVYYLGCYKDIKQAALARKVAEEELWHPLLEKHIGGFRDDKERNEKVQLYIKNKIEERLGDSQK